MLMANKLKTFDLIITPSREHCQKLGEPCMHRRGELPSMKNRTWPWEDIEDWRKKNLSQRSHTSITVYIICARMALSKYSWDIHKIQVSQTANLSIFWAHQFMQQLKTCYFSTCDGKEGGTGGGEKDNQLQWHREENEWKQGIAT